MTAIREREAWLRATLAGLGFELVDLESSQRGLLRVFVDAPGGVTIDDCARVSRHLTQALAAEAIDYDRLEVSSPGLDRPLKRPADFERFAGREASIRLKLPVEGRRRFEGRIAGLEGDGVVLEWEGRRQRFAFADIERARLVPDV